MNTSIGYTGTSDDVGGAVYMKGFGAMAHKTVFSDPMNQMDYRPEMKSFIRAERKALVTTAGGAGTAGYALVPVAPDMDIIDQSRKYTPWTEIIRRVTNIGTYADYNLISAKGSAVTKAEDAPLSDVTDTEDRASTPIKYLYSVGRITGQMQAAMPAYTVTGLAPTGTGITSSGGVGSSSAKTAKQYEVLKRARAIKEKEEALIWTGNAGTTATEFSGIQTLQGTTNKKDLNTTAMEWDNIEEVAQYTYDDSGRPSIGACPSAVARDVRNIMLDTFRVNPRDLGSTVGFGIPAPLTLETLVGTIPVVPTQNLSNASGSKELYLLDTDVIEMRVLQDMTYDEDIANTGDSKKFFLKIYEAIINKCTKFSGFVGEIA